MSNYHFGDDYDLNYYPQEASDGMGGVDWDKVERVEIEFDVYVKERTCEMEYSGGVPDFVSLDTWSCTECGSPIYNDCEPSYCPYCGAKVVGE